VQTRWARRRRVLPRALPSVHGALLRRPRGRVRARAGRGAGLRRVLSHTGPHTTPSAW
jgi:hypothetical protein